MEDAYTAGFVFVRVIFQSTAPTSTHEQLSLLQVSAAAQMVYFFILYVLFQLGIAVQYNDCKISLTYSYICC